jgi:hypothetical protein
VQEIELASENIRKSDDANRDKLERIESRYATLENSVNDLFKRTGRPGGEWSSDLRTSANPNRNVPDAHNERLPKSDLLTTEYTPSSGIRDVVPVLDAF